MDDIKLFTSYNNIKNHTGLTLNKNICLNLYDCNKHLEPIVLQMLSLIKIDSVYNKIKTNKEFINYTYNYHIHLENVNTLNQKQQLWINRTYLFYQLIIFTIQVITSRELYENLYSGDNSFYKRNKFREDIEYNLIDFKFGIYGSIKLTSDIDMGIQYSGSSLKKPGLSYIISILEDLYMIILGKPCLDFDIESYADMYTYKYNSKHKEDTHSKEDTNVLFLDTSKISKKDFNELLPYAGASILRNYYIALQSTLQYNVNIKDNIKQYIDKFNVDECISSIETYKDTRNISSIASRKISTKKNPYFVKLISIIKEHPIWIEKAKALIYDYIQMDYTAYRNKYYKLVNITESLILNKDIAYINNNIVKIVKSIAHTAIYRKDNYICTPTIVHIVQLLQKNKNKYKYRNIIPKIYCKDIDRLQYVTYPVCNIGEYGFLLSAFEQLGYIYRYHIIYCNKPFGALKIDYICKQKYKKYIYRFNSAMSYYYTYYPNSNLIKKNTITKKIKPSQKSAKSAKSTKSPKSTNYI